IRSRDRLSHHPRARTEGGTTTDAVACVAPGGPRSRATGRAAARPGDGSCRGRRRAAGDAAGRGARHLPVARARRAGRGRRRARLGGDPARPRGRGLRRRAGLGRRPPAPVAASLEFPEAVGNELTLRRALAGLVETALARPERRDRFVRKVALSARLESGGSWRRTLTLREPSADPDRIRVALSP